MAPTDPTDDLALMTKICGEACALVALLPRLQQPALDSVQLSEAYLRQIFADLPTHLRHAVASHAASASVKVARVALRHGLNFAASRALVDASEQVTDFFSLYVE